jgi:hypothetical protein
MTPKRGKVRKVTDKERLDWVLNPGNMVHSFGLLWYAMTPVQQYVRRNPRAAIDAAIRASLRKVKPQ